MYPLFEQYFQPGKFTYEEIYGLFDPSFWSIVNPFRRLESDQFAVFDLTGTGNCPIYFYSIDNDQGISSIVFVRPEKSKLSDETVRKLCEIFALDDKKPICIKGRDIYTNNFAPIIREKFDNGSLNISDAKKLLSSFALTEKIDYPKLYFEFHDSNYSIINFYFDENRKLDHIAFVQYGSTTIIDRATLVDLCIKFNMTISKELCNYNTEPSSEELISIIRKEFPIGVATYEDVQKKLGKYQVDFDPPVKINGYEPVVISWYDLSGSNQFRLKFNFDLNFVVTGISWFRYGDS